MTAQCSTWPHWGRFFHRQLRRLDGSEAVWVFDPILDYREFKRTMLDLEQQHCYMIDRAIHRFCSRNRWPPLNCHQKYFLRMRLEYADILCQRAYQNIATRPFSYPLPDAGSDIVLPALTVSGWRSNGLRAWTSALHDLWLEVLEFTASAEEINAVTEEVRGKRIVSLLVHRTDDFEAPSAPNADRCFAIVIQCYNGSRWTSRGVSPAPPELDRVQKWFNNCPEEFTELSTAD